MTVDHSAPVTIIDLKTRLNIIIYIEILEFQWRCFDDEMDDDVVLMMMTFSVLPGVDDDDEDDVVSGC